jgi:hypothetical protein
MVTFQPWYVQLFNQSKPHVNVWYVRDQNESYETKCYSLNQEPTETPTETYPDPDHTKTILKLSMQVLRVLELINIIHSAAIIIIVLLIRFSGTFYARLQQY